MKNFILTILISVLLGSIIGISIYGLVEKSELELVAKTIAGENYEGENKCLVASYDFHKAWTEKGYQSVVVRGFKEGSNTPHAVIGVLIESQTGEFTPISFTPEKLRFEDYILKILK